MPKHEGIGYSEMFDTDQQPRPGIRSQIAVVDYDGDGKLDLLVGDFCTYLHMKKDLTLEHRKKMEAIRGQQDITVKQLRQSMEDLRAEFKKSLKGVPKSDWNSPENSAKWQKMYTDMKATPTYKKLNQEYEQLQKDLLTYVENGNSPGGDPAKAHGYVWLFRQK